MTTVSEVEAEEVGGKAVSLEADPGTLRRQVRTRASSVTPAALAAAIAVTQRVRAAGAAASKAGALLDRPGSLIHAQPPTFRQAMDRHHECAGHIRTWTPLRAGRYAWGWFHLLFILPPLYLLAWVTESPLRLFIAAALAAAIWIWS